MCCCIATNQSNDALKPGRNAGKEKGMRIQKILFKYTLFLAGLTGLNLIPSSYALDLSGVGALTFSNFSVNAPVTSSMQLGVGVGALGAISVSPFFSLESGVLFLKHSASVNPGQGPIDISNQLMEIPLMVRFSPLSLISVNGGVYYGVTTASSLTYTDPSSAKTTSDGPKTNDYGFILGAGVRFPLAPFVKLRADVFYQIGLADWGSIPGVSQYTRNIDVLAGAMLDIW